MSDNQNEIMPPWMQSIRAALTDSINHDDLKAIMQKQVELAVKEGDLKAAKFVFDQAQKIAAPKGMTVIQNNNYFSVSDQPQGSETTAGSRAASLKAKTARPGSTAKIALMRRRIEAGLDATDKSDVGVDDATVDLS